MSTRKISDLPSKSVGSEQAEDVKGGRKLKKFGGRKGSAKKRKNATAFGKAGNDD